MLFLGWVEQWARPKKMWFGSPNSFADCVIYRILYNYWKTAVLSPMVFSQSIKNNHLQKSP